MSRRGSHAFRRRVDGDSEHSDSLWPPSSPGGWLLLFGSYALIGVLAVVGFVGAFVLFGGWRLLDGAPTWARWAAYGSAGLVALLIAGGLVAGRRR